MNPNPQAPPTGAPHKNCSVESIHASDIPQLVILKKRKVEIETKIKNTKQNWKAHASFDIAFWTQAMQIEELELKSSELKRKISICQSDTGELDWSKTVEAQRIMEQIKASEQCKRIYQRRVHELEQGSHARSFRAAFMNLFTTSKIGLGIQTTGAGKRSSTDQSNFRQKLIQAYEARHRDNTWLWCPIFQDYLDANDVVAAHLFSWKHGQANMDAIFGKQKETELCSPRNGILMSRHIEECFDIGKLVIVPWIPDTHGTKMEALRRWLESSQREYQLKILDSNWDRLEKPISRYYQLRYKDLDGRKLQFVGSFRPAARYLYFHYCIQVLRRSWQYNESKSPVKAASVLREENGKPFWGTPGRYLPKNMLLALVEELGHEYKPLLQGAARKRSGDFALLELAAAQVKSRRPALDGTFAQSDSESDDEEIDGNLSC